MHASHSEVCGFRVRIQVVRQYITSNIFGGNDVMHVFEIAFNLYLVDISNNILMFSMMCCEASY